MKNLKSIALAFAFLLVTLMVNSQIAGYSTFGSTSVGETTLEYDGNPNPAFVINFEGDHKDLEKSWKDYLKDNYSIKLKKSGGLLIGQEANLADITSKMVTIYSSVNEKSPDAGLTIAVSVNRFDFLSRANNPVEAEKIVAFIRRFAKNYQLERVNNELSELQKTYDDINSDLQKVLDDKADVDKNLVKLEGKILEANADISKQEKKILDLEAEIQKLNTEIAENKIEIEEYNRKLVNINRDIETEKGRLAMQKEKLDNINAKKQLILSE